MKLFRRAQSDEIQNEQPVIQVHEPRSGFEAFSMMMVGMFFFLKNYPKTAVPAVVFAFGGLAYFFIHHLAE